MLRIVTTLSMICLFAGQASAQDCRLVSFTDEVQARYETIIAELERTPYSSNALPILDELLEKPLNCNEYRMVLQLRSLIGLVNHGADSYFQDLEALLLNRDFPDFTGPRSLGHVLEDTSNEVLRESLNRHLDLMLAFPPQTARDVLLRATACLALARNDEALTWAKIGSDNATGETRRLYLELLIHIYEAMNSFDERDDAIELLAQFQPVIDPIKDLSFDMDAQLIEQPTIAMPSKAIKRKIKGDCEARFDVDERGYVVDLVVTCSHRIFKTTVERSVGNLRFFPKRINGDYLRRNNLVLPLVFDEYW